MDERGGRRSYNQTTNRKFQSIIKRLINSGFAGSNGGWKNLAAWQITGVTLEAVSRHLKLGFIDHNTSPPPRTQCSFTPLTATRGGKGVVFLPHVFIIYVDSVRSVGVFASQTCFVYVSRRQLADMFQLIICIMCRWKRRHNCYNLEVIIKHN